MLFFCALELACVECVGMCVYTEEGSTVVFASTGKKTSMWRESEDGRWR